MKAKLSTLFIFLLPLGSIAQQIGPVHWTAKITDPYKGVCEVVIEATIQESWWVYHPNAPNGCVQPTLVKVISDTNRVKQLDDFNVVDYGETDFDRSCLGKRYYRTMLITCPIEIREKKDVTVRIAMVYQPSTRYGPSDIKTVNFYIPVKGGAMAHLRPGEGQIVRPIPRTIMHRFIWCIAHPFKKPFWKYQ